jgi:hypothetical protein
MIFIGFDQKKSCHVSASRLYIIMYPADLAALTSLSPEILITVLALAVLIAPAVYRWRTRVRRYLRSLIWIGLGFLLGALFCCYALDPIATGQSAAAFTHVLAAF